MNGKQNRNNSQHQDRYRIDGSDTEHPVQSDTSKKTEDPTVSGNQADTRMLSNISRHNQESKKKAQRPGQNESSAVLTDKTLPDGDKTSQDPDREPDIMGAESDKIEHSKPEHDLSSSKHQESTKTRMDGNTSDLAKSVEDRIRKGRTNENAMEEDKNDKTVSDRKEDLNDRAAERRRPDETQPNKKQTGTSTGKHDRARNFGSFYLGVAAAFLVAALGLSLSTLPIFFSIPLSAVLFGIGIWLLSYASLQSPDQPPESGSGTDRHTTTVVVTAVLLVLQTFIMDVFIFTRLGSVQEHQNPVIITWIVATVIETIAAFVLIFRHNPSSSKTSPSQDTKEQDTD